MAAKAEATLPTQTINIKLICIRSAAPEDRRLWLLPNGGHEREFLRPRRA